ncbi:hypothetical protein E6P09_08145 [Haloferax mediterranei ATCC 33500]|uniref:Uncharacterized protein n=1 Tax=Haloferax mediterranei (strain ATCC 33500 / DSM 1411 / JCM 8866 / NBRC 14739 / NCIMB 2177 / R-4) TaxID=523841 RepID=M0J370_HALMT|nr:hypothetical protein [Haloferax mediterranei]AHZ21893.1 hypothetical protein BM92_04110 [Haloferax mediterranei ATCC 33500]EMA03401.1 hypothetical protein C439_05365 [Haloferax mediterranei ATCC 33500]MDX5988835.1 hypothetical protein [Haloferax mediterranei ATCC 33500]QCQ75237.1 hypothetical protein E6P09_08145 [Haloferax mediterranei ATCC 33500]
MNRTRSYVFARDATVATAVLVGLFVLRYVQFQPLQIPGYLLIVGFDVIEAVFGSAGANYDVLFAAYLVGLGVVGAGVAQVVRQNSKGTDIHWWRLGAASALALLGVVSLLFAAMVLFTTTQLTPVYVTGAAGLVFLALAAWLTDIFRIEVGPGQ